MQVDQGWTPSSGGRSLPGGRCRPELYRRVEQERSRSYLTDPSAKACRAGLSAMACQADDQRNKAKHLLKGTPK